MKRVMLAAVALLIALAPAAEAGRRGGPGVDTVVVRANGATEYFVTFEGGMPAVITVVRDGDSDLDLYVYDDFGLVAKDDGPTERCLVAFTPAATTTYKVRVVNRGVANRYTMRTN